MTFRLSSKLAARLKAAPSKVLPLDPNPFADWSAPLFTAAAQLRAVEGRSCEVVGYLGTANPIISLRGTWHHAKKGSEVAGENAALA